ncbi:MAG: phage integrase SAM-like domain-containing protein [Alistipes sp.]|nr:phage integrase SAM-like domain-containing protein [Alistipes sp.]
MISLVIRSKQPEGEAMLYTRMKIDGKSKWINLQLPVDIKKWREVSTSLKKQTNYLDRLGYSKKIADIEFATKELRQRNCLTEEAINDAVQNTVLVETRERIKQQDELEQYISKRQNKSVKTWIKGYIAKIESGEARTYQGERYAPNSIRNWKQFLRVFLDFCKTTNDFCWEEITQSLVNKYMSFLEEKGYAKSAIDRFINCFKTLIGVAEREDIHNNYKARGLFRHATVKDHEKTTAIYLTKEELEGLYNMELVGLEEEVRDAFLIACYTGQRHSDFSQLKTSCFDTIFDGKMVIRKVQTKTTTQVVIPILDNKLKIILEKYNYKVPEIGDIVMNRYLKRIGEKLSHTVKSLAKDVKTILTKDEREAEKSKKKTFRRDEDGNVIKYKWELIVTHTGRRTCATNMYLSRKYTTREMMLVTGHKKEENFMKYIKLSLDEEAHKLAMISDGEMF